MALRLALPINWMIFGTTIPVVFHHVGPHGPDSAFRSKKNSEMLQNPDQKGIFNLKMPLLKINIGIQVNICISHLCQNSQS